MTIVEQEKIIAELARKLMAESFIKGMGNGMTASQAVKEARHIYESVDRAMRIAKEF